MSYEKKRPAKSISVDTLRDTETRRAISTLRADTDKKKNTMATDRVRGRGDPRRVPHVHLHKAEKHFKILTYATLAK
jgi:hypothetical protein